MLHIVCIATATDNIETENEKSKSSAASSGVVGGRREK